MPSYVILWENNTSGHRAVSGKTWAGHAALNVGSIFPTPNKRSTKSYVSWWPQSAQKFSVFGIIGKALTPQALSKAGEAEQFFLQDVADEKYLPDHVIELRTADDQESRMLGEWKTISNTFTESQTKYHALRQNCSTIVSRVLHAGGFYSHKWSVDTHWAWTPADVRVMLRGRGRYMSWAEFLQVLSNSGIRESDLPVSVARSGRLCTTGAECRFQKNEPFYWRNK